jgi:hypothetical protein
MEECHDSRAPLLDDAVGSCKRDATATMRTGASENRIEKCDVRCQSVKRQKSTGKENLEAGGKVRQGKARQESARQGKARQGKARQGKAGIRKREHSRLQVSSEIASGFAAVLLLQATRTRLEVVFCLRHAFPGQRCCCGLHVIDCCWIFLGTVRATCSFSAWCASYQSTRLRFLVHVQSSPLAFFSATSIEMLIGL